MKKVGIIGVGEYLPKKVLTNADLEKMVDTSDEWITTRTGIKERQDRRQKGSSFGFGDKGSAGSLRGCQA